MDRGDPMSRYARQMILPEVGVEGQKRLSSACVLVVGCGGLAAPVLPLLAGAGVGQMILMDADIVDVSNLHRQTLYTEADCATSKAEAAGRRCQQINSEIGVEIRNQALTPANALELVNRANLILDCADSYAASYTLSDACLDLGKPLISASVLSMAGYVGGFCGGAPSLRAVFPDAPERGDSCATSGVLGPVVAMVGSIQAQMALAVLLDLDPSPLGQMMQLDARNFRSTSFRFDKTPEPQNALRFEAANQLSDNDLIVELRDEAEAPVPIHPKARRIHPDALPEGLEVPAKRLALCCATGLRAWRAAERIQPNWPGEIVLVAASTS